MKSKLKFTPKQRSCRKKIALSRGIRICQNMFFVCDFALKFDRWLSETEKIKNFGRKLPFFVQNFGNSSSFHA